MAATVRTVSVDEALLTKRHQLSPRLRSRGFALSSREQRVLGASLRVLLTFDIARLGCCLARIVRWHGTQKLLRNHQFQVDHLPVDQRTPADSLRHPPVQRRHGGDSNLNPCHLPLRRYHSRSPSTSRVHQHVPVQHLQTLRRRLGLLPHRRSQARAQTQCKDQPLCVGRLRSFVRVLRSLRLRVGHNRRSTCHWTCG